MDTEEKWKKFLLIVKKIKGGEHASPPTNTPRSIVIPQVSCILPEHHQ